MNNRNRFLPYLLITPTLVFVAMFTVTPLVGSLISSLFRQQLNIPKYQTPQWVGLGNFTALFADKDFLQILANTGLYVIVLIPGVLIGALALSLLVWRKFRGQEWFRMTFFHPVVLPMVSGATVWLFFFTPGYGIVNQVLDFFGYSGPQNWTGNPDMAIWTLIIVAFWKQVGFAMIFLLAGLQNFDRSVLEAARLDGARGPSMLFRIILPLLRRQLLFVNTITLIGTFQTVDHVFVLTQGGPSGKSSLLLYYLWELRFSQLNIGKAAAVTVFLVAVLLALTLTNFKVSERNER